MFEHIRPYRHIVVTGPQRSGTKFVAEIAAEELGLRYIPESAYGFHAFDRFWSMLSEDAVVHAPTMSAYCHLLPAAVAVVFVIRNVADIAASQARIPDWNENEEPRELRKYFRWPASESIAAVKYDAWERIQKPAMAADGKPAFECRFPDDVAAHQRFVPAEERSSWAPHQTDRIARVRIAAGHRRAADLQPTSAEDLDGQPIPQRLFDRWQRAVAEFDAVNAELLAAMKPRVAGPT